MAVLTYHSHSYVSNKLTQTAFLLFILSLSISTMIRTATADGQMMARMLSTFSNMEQSRFAAYKRATLNAGAVQAWVGTCLFHRLADTPRVSSNEQRQQLSELVTPGSHNEIGMVVAIAAKVYAQRLVAAAVQVATRDNATGKTASTLPQQPQAALQPEHVWQALEERQRAGLDPGFYLQSNEPLQWSTVNSRQDYDQRRLAALEAQEAFDKMYGAPEESDDDDKSEKEDDSKKDVDDTTAMDVTTTDSNSPKVTSSTTLTSYW
jgi:hypothetical protein